MTGLRIVSENLTKKYSGKPVFKDLSFSLSSGESAVIVGRNGSGKSTLMKIISGIISPSGGSLTYLDNGRVLERGAVRKLAGFVSPYLNLYDELSAAENLRLFSGLKSNSSGEDEDRLSHYLNFVGLFERRNDEVKEYSSGMKQKLKIAFAMLHEPRVLMMDEPRSNLDRDGISIIEKVAEKQKEKGILIIATNDEDDLNLCSIKISVEEFKQ